MCSSHTCATPPWNKSVRDIVWGNVSDSSIYTAKLLHFSTVWKDFPGCSVICRLSVAFSAALMSLGIWRCLLCGNAVVMSCKSAWSMLIFLAKPLGLFQGPAKSWWRCPRRSMSPCTFIVAFCLFQQGRMNLKKFDLCLVKAHCGWTQTPPADPFLLLGLQVWTSDRTVSYF